MATQNYGEQRIDIEDIPPIPTNQTSSSSSSGDPSDPGLTFIHILFVLSVIQVVASLVGLWVSIVYEHPDYELIAWVVGYASGCAVFVIFPLLYFRCRITSTLNLRCPNAPSGCPRTVGAFDIKGVILSWPMCRVNLNPLISWTNQRKVMTGFWITMSFFFLVWYGLGIAFFAGGSFSNHGAPRLETYKFLLHYSISIDTPDSLGALPTCKFKSKESGGRSGDEGGIVLAGGTEKERTLSGEEVVCCICLRKFADNDEVREVPCCSHFFHVGCLDKWLKIKAPCPLSQSQLGVAAEGVTDATHSSHNPS
ncbi:hypothetical protein AAG906_014689 [Vitis piasezkii]